MAIKTIFKLLSKVSPHSAGVLAAAVFQCPRKLSQKEWETKVEKQGQRIRLNKGLSALRWGQSPRSVFLIHGWEGRSTQFEAFIQPLLAEGFSVIGIDGPAHGQSSGRKANPMLFAQAIEEAIIHFGHPRAIIGHSMGGAAALWAAIRNPSIPNVVTISAPTNLSSILDNFSTHMKLTPAANDAFFQQVQRQTGVDSRDFIAHKIGPLLTAQKGLIIHSHDDLEVPIKDAKDLHKHWSGSELWSPSNLGHRRIMRHSTVVRRTVEFIREYK